ncbi:hypothetical protein AAHZ94_19135 [Streptomyces sp. HSW2009]|uniref:hypothetical protein n=1 Tax=Streptomyces sp. HSW2009 TaxID=3142890 RepID=UPI0032EB1150
MRSITLGVALGVAALTLAAGASGPAAAEPAAGGKALTWTFLADGPGGTVQVGGGPLADPYQGDTSTSTALPVLCLKVDGSPVPAGLTPDFYAGWSRGHVAVSNPVRGNRLTSLAVANGVCENTFGKGWRFAEFHDGRYGPNLADTGGWSFWAHGDVPVGTRFWTHINDQPANPWN